MQNRRPQRLQRLEVARQLGIHPGRLLERATPAMPMARMSPSFASSARSGVSRKSTVRKTGQRQDLQNGGGAGEIIAIEG